MWMIGIVWASVVTMLLIADITSSWAVETAEAHSFNPHQFRMNQLLGPERVMDSNPAVPGVRGNSVPNVQKWNAILLQASQNALRQQGLGTSPTGEVVSHKNQNIQSQMGRIQ